MTIIKESFRDIDGGKARGWVEFMCAAIRISADGTRTITTKPVRCPLINGELESPNLDPGPAIVTVSVGSRREYPIVIPDSSTSVRLYDLLDQYTELPPPIVSQAWQAAQAAIQARNEVDAFVQQIANQFLPEIGSKAQLAYDSMVAAEQAADRAFEAIPPATTTQLGKIRLAGDLAGTADAPTVPGLAVLTTQMASKADLDGSGKIPQAQLPAIAVTEFLGSVGSQAAMLALTGQRGDWCNRTDLGTEWQLIAEPSSSLSSWQQKVYPASEVTSVAGRKGAVTLSVGDVSGAAPLASPALTGSPKVNGVAVVVGNDARLTDARDTTVARVTDATVVGRNLMKATDAAAARDAIGALAVDVFNSVVEMFGKRMVEDGAWSSTKNYSGGEVVTYNHSRYYCNNGHAASATFPAANFVWLGLAAVASATDPGGGRLWVKI